MIGIYSRDINLKMYHTNKLFYENTNTFKYPIILSSKYDKFKNQLEFLKDTKFLTMDRLKFDDALKLLTKETNSKLTLVEGLEDICLDYLHLPDPFNIPFDILVMSFVKDGVYKQQEVSMPFEIWKEMEKNYVKVYQSHTFIGKDGSTWFFVVFKKRILFEKNREIIELSQETSLFDSKFFRNDF
jgi:hypothetical protein